MAKIEQVIFIGLGVMGEPMCRNLVKKSGLTVVGFNRNMEPLERLTSCGVVPAPDLAVALTNVDALLLSLPNGAKV